MKDAPPDTARRGILVEMAEIYIYMGRFSLCVQVGIVGHIIKDIPLMAVHRLAGFKHGCIHLLGRFFN